jgi:CubicO group peptidase (beta-lactamase class C family)
VSLEQCLTHTSGVPSYTNSTESLAAMMKKVYSLDSLIILFGSDSLEFELGARFEYSNSGYLILARIAELIEDKTFEELVREKLFRPAGMASSSLGSASAVGYLYGKPEPFYPIENILGAGGITTTASDLVLWSEALDDNKVLAFELKAKMWTPYAEYKDWESDYGLGWMIDGFQFKASKKHNIVHHPDTDMGFYSMFVKQPDSEITIILLSNHGHFPRFDITDIILNELN